MGYSRGGLTTKIQASVDADGRPIRLTLTPGQAGELLADPGPGATLLTDRANDRNSIRRLAAEHKAWTNIPPRATRKDTISFSPWLCRQRNLVGRLFNHINRLRGSITRCDRRADNYLAALKFAAIRIWIASI